MIPEEDGEKLSGWWDLNTDGKPCLVEDVFRIIYYIFHKYGNVQISFSV